MKNILLRLIYCLPIGCGTVYAQSPQQAIEKFKSQTPVLSFPNAALLKGQNLPGAGEAQLGFLQDNGSFKHPFDARLRKGVSFNASRAHSLKNWDFYGSFDFKTLNEKDVPLTDMANPFRDNPYQVADSLSGEWNKQQYILGVKIAAPALMNGKLVPGLGIRYEVLTGARQKDPRPLDYSNQLDLTPGLVYKFNPDNFLGINGVYSTYREDLTVELYNYRQVYNTYKLLGLGEYQYSAAIPLSSGTITRAYKGAQYGGDIQYGHKAGRLNVLLSAGYRNYKEDLTDGTTYPQNGGQHLVNEYNFMASSYWSGHHTFNQFLLEWKQKDMDNREYHQVQDATTKQYETIYSSVFNTALKTRAVLTYRFNKLKEDDTPNWEIKAAAGYNGFDNRYTYPRSWQTVDKMDVSMAFDKYIGLANAAAFSFGLNSLYEFAFRDRLDYTMKDYSSNYVANNILFPVQAFLTASSWNNQLRMQYTFRNRGKGKSQLFVKGTGYLNTAMEGNEWIKKGSTRQGFQFTIGIYN